MFVKCAPMLCLAPLVACAGGEDTSASSMSAMTESHVEATHCELFVDKAVPTHNSHGARRVTLYLKTLNDRLDSPIARVGMRYAIRDPRHDCDSGFSMAGCGEVGTFADHDAGAIAPDYFFLELEIANDFTFAHQYEGVMYVITQRGTTYWHKTRERTNFFIDDKTMSDLEDAVHEQGISTPIFAAATPDPMPKTADFFEYLNADRCR
jgi:hypothetical protein